MSIQIFGRNKCFATRKAERFFKERGIPVQRVDLQRYGLSGKEFDGVVRAVGGVDHMIDWEKKDPIVDQLRYTENPRDKEDIVYENQQVIRAPVVRNGKQATVGYCPERWKTWIEK